jgi:hypothetical protein
MVNKVLCNGKPLFSLVEQVVGFIFGHFGFLSSFL